MHRLGLPDHAGWLSDKHVDRRHSPSRVAIRMVMAQVDCAQLPHIPAETSGSKLKTL